MDKKGFTPLEIQKRLNLNLRIKAKSPFGSIFSITKRSGKFLTGFTIIEVILAIFILTTAAFGSFNLIQQVIIAGSLNQSRLTAYYFAQQEIENIKNIRDTNYVQGNDWNIGINNSSLAVINFLDNTSSKFSRQINVTPATDSSGNSYLDIKVIVQWSERGRNHSVEVVNHLYDWFDN